MMTTTTANRAAAIGTAPPARLARPRRPVWRRSNGDQRIALFFIAPALVGFITFYVVPFVRGIYLSFTEYSLLGDPTWVGGANYAAIATDPLFWNSLVVTGEYVLINIVLQTTLALGLALLMNRVAKSSLIRGALLLPYLMANVIAALLWFWLLDYQIGIVNYFIDAVGLPRVAFFGSEIWAIPTQALINTWRHVGYTALLIFAGLQAIPRQLYEVADLDGASPSQVLRRITLPLLRPVLALVLIVTAIGSIQIFDTVAVTTQGGPINASRVLQFYIYQRAFTESDFGYGSALAVILFAILAVVSFVLMKAFRGNESDLD